MQVNRDPRYEHSGEDRQKLDVGFGELDRLREGVVDAVLGVWVFPTRVTAKATIAGRSLAN